MLTPAEHRAEALRWAKYPATLLFALSLIWLLHNVRYFGGASGGELFHELSQSGSGLLLLLVSIVIIPLGSVVCAIYLLLRRSWAALPAALLPILPLVDACISRAPRIAGKLHAYHESGELREAINAVTDILTLAVLWAGWLLALAYLYQMHRHLKASTSAVGSRSPVNGARASSPPVAAASSSAIQTSGQDALVPIASEGDVCFLMPETEDIESA